MNTTITDQLSPFGRYDTQRASPLILISGSGELRYSVVISVPDLNHYVAVVDTIMRFHRRFERNEGPWGSVAKRMKLVAGNACFSRVWSGWDLS
ncbi:MAG: hypothetical protein M1546_13615 [Chloroflexi bacterium]|nr:hypothetical protein [Chloroflexota bacterium]